MLEMFSLRPKEIVDKVHQLILQMGKANFFSVPLNP